MVPWVADWPLGAVLALFLGATAAIAWAGTRLARLADRLADLTRLGEALFGAVLLGGSTSLPEIVTSTTTAVQNYPQLAVSNAIGGIAAQTAFLAVADILYREANLEHAGASLENLVQAALLCSLIAVVLLGTGSPDVAVLGVHPVSVLLIAGYAFGIRVVAKTRAEPLWRATLTPQTRPDRPSKAQARPGEGLRLGIGFALLALLVAAAGYLLAQAAIVLVQRTGLSQSIVGGLFTAVATSLPELVTTLAAVRHGALTLAVGGIIGGNTFDVIIVALSDVFYRGGSIYHAVSAEQIFILSLALLLTGILLMGLLRREKTGVANIGFESFLVLLLYLAGLAMLIYRG